MERRASAACDKVGGSGLEEEEDEDDMITLSWTATMEC